MFCSEKIQALLLFVMHNQRPKGIFTVKFNMFLCGIVIKVDVLSRRALFSVIIIKYIHTYFSDKIVTNCKKI